MSFFKIYYRIKKALENKPNDQLSKIKRGIRDINYHLKEKYIYILFKTKIYVKKFN